MRLLVCVVAYVVGLGLIAQAVDWPDPLDVAVACLAGVLLMVLGAVVGIAHVERWSRR